MIMVFVLLRPRNCCAEHVPLLIVVSLDETMERFGDSSRVVQAGLGFGRSRTLPGARLTIGKMIDISMNERLTIDDR